MKYLEVPDYHFNPAWSDFSTQMGHAVAKAARENNVDFIACPGDWFDAPIYASDKGGLRAAMAIMREWTEICPVIAIEGTPSHDAPGCYEIFRELPGFTLIEPGKVYGYAAGAVVEWLDGYQPDGLIFGIPELSKKNIQARLKPPRRGGQRSRRAASPGLYRAVYRP